MSERDIRSPREADETPDAAPDPFFDLASDMMAVASASSSAWLRINPAFEHLLGWDEGELHDQPLVKLVHKDDQEALAEALDRANSRLPGQSVRLRLLRGDGAYVPTLWRFSIGATNDQLLCVGRANAEQDSQALAASVRQLGHELQHRVRNTLAVIRSIVRRTGEIGRSSDELASHLQGRIDAYARVLSQLNLSAPVGAGVDLASLVAEELLAQSQLEGEKLAIEGPDLLLNPKAAEAFGLAIHELAMNSIKFGAFRSSGGKIEIGWHIDRGPEGATLFFAWTETGMRLADAKSAEPGFGMETLLRSLPYELMAETDFEFRPQGISFKMAVPLERLTIT